tara:strand:+ start:257 stop:730 length:474 start_codon:yes stop_codon:yes gene_type:complete
MFEKKYTVLWADLDANWHLANFSYLKYSTDARMSFFKTIGLTKENLLKQAIGPIVFYEHLYYYKEIILDDNFSITVEIDGYSEDQRFGKLIQNFYDVNKVNMARIEILFSLFDTKRRKLSKFPDQVFENIKNGQKTDSFKIITKNDTRVQGKLPKNL